MAATSLLQPQVAKLHNITLNTTLKQLHVPLYIPYCRKFSWDPIFTLFVDERLSMKLDLQNKYDCTVYNGHDHMRPRKLNLAVHENWTHENFPLYGIAILIFSPLVPVIDSFHCSLCTRSCKKIQICRKRKGLKLWQLPGQRKRSSRR